MASVTKDLIDAINAMFKRKTSEYDATATVKRIEGNRAWVHINGGVDETPVDTMTINARVGDTVRVHVGGGKAWIIGNATAPPTDDRKADVALRRIGNVSDEVLELDEHITSSDRKIEAVTKIAGDTNQYFWHTQEGTDTGAHITEKPQEEFLDDPTNGGSNLLARSNGIAVRDGLDELATFGANGVQIGKISAAHSIIDANGQRVYAPDGTTQIANLGYGEGQSDSGTAVAPYYTLGTRASDTVATRGNYSVVEGYSNTASGRAAHAEGYYNNIASAQGAHAEGGGNTASGVYSHAEGQRTEASGENAHAQGFGTIASKESQTVLGVFNEEDTSPATGNHRSGAYALIVGNGSGSSSKSNAFTVGWNGYIEIGNPSMTFAESIHTVVNDEAIAAGDYKNGTTNISKSGYYPIAISGWRGSSRYFSCNRAYLTNQANGSAVLNWLVFNGTSASHTATMDIRVLWIRVA